jgi:thiol-disulfide isomerase/thioredoxin
LSKGIEAFISRMIADGPSANRPPHIALEPPLSLSRSLKLAVLGLAVVVAGCNKESKQAAQPQASNDTGASAPAAAAGGGELPRGMLDRSHKGSALPDFTLADAAGGKLKLADLKGKPALINLWATWCAPCVAELPTLNAIANRADMNLRVVTVSQDSTATDKVRAFLDSHGVAQLPAWLDPKNDLSASYDVQTLPTTIYYDAQGKELWRYVGGHDWSGPDAAKLLAEAK